jgi:hypothetical protein
MHLQNDTYSRCMYLSLSNPSTALQAAAWPKGHKQTRNSKLHDHSSQPLPASAAQSQAVAQTPQHGSGFGAVLGLLRRLLPRQLQYTAQSLRMYLIKYS